MSAVNRSVIFVHQFSTFHIFCRRVRKMEPPREEEKRTAKKRLAARRGVGSEEDGVHLAGFGGEL